MNIIKSALLQIHLRKKLMLFYYNVMPPSVSSDLLCVHTTI